MRQRYVGRSGLQVSGLGLGTWSWGDETDEHEVRDLLKTFVDAGGTLVDTAPTYADGASEVLLGRLLGATVARRDVVVASKAGRRPGPQRPDGTFPTDASRRAMLDALDQTLHRLGTDHLDLWQVHLWDSRVPLDETLGALDEAVRSGRTRYVGVSNYAGWQLALASARQTERGAAPLVSHQAEYSLLARDVEHEAVPAGDALGIGLLAYSPLAGGVLTAKYRTGTPMDSRAAGPKASRVEPYLEPAAAGVVESVVRAADGLELTPLQVALAWVRDRPTVASALIGPRSLAQLQGCLDTVDVTLPAQIVAALDDVSA